MYVGNIHHELLSILESQTDCLTALIVVLIQQSFFTLFLYHATGSLLPLIMPPWGGAVAGH